MKSDHVEMLSIALGVVLVIFWAVRSLVGTELAWPGVGVLLLGLVFVWGGAVTRSISERLKPDQKELQGLMDEVRELKSKVNSLSLAVGFQKDRG